MLSEADVKTDAFSLKTGRHSASLLDVSFFKYFCDAFALTQQRKENSKEKHSSMIDIICLFGLVSKIKNKQTNKF